MSKNIVITIGREFGSGGREIGQRIAQALDIGFFDKNLIDIAAKKSGMDSAVLYQADEKASNPFFSAYLPSGAEYGTVNDRLFWTQSSIIKDLAENQSCVIAGRCGDYILADYENCLHVFVYAPLEVRIERIMERYLIDTPNAAKKEIHREDKVRRSYYQYYTDLKWGKTEGKHLSIDSSFLGIDGTVALVLEIVQKKWPDFKNESSSI